MTALTVTRCLLGRHTFTSSFFASLAIPSFFTPSWSPLRSLIDLFPQVLLAVPKSKISHSRKSMRSANKGLKDKHNIVNCPGCGTPKFAHHLCPNCYNFLSRLWKSKRKEGSGGDIVDLP